jgi:hypothetical protein
MNEHSFQRLIPGIPVTGETPETDPEYGWAYVIVEQVAHYGDELREECWYDGIHTEAEGDVHLTLKGRRIARVEMDGHYADSVLQVLDPR